VAASIIGPRPGVAKPRPADKPKWVNANEWATRRRERYEPPADSPPGKPSDFIAHLRPLAREKPGLKIYLYNRESAVTQEYGGNLDDQEAANRRRARRLGCKVVGSDRGVESGWKLDGHGERCHLGWAVDRAREAGADVLVAESMSRFIRSVYFTNKRQDARPTVLEFEKLRELTEGFPLATFLHPDADWKRERGYQAKRGQREKGNPGGRPVERRDRYREKMLPLARTLREHGWSYDRVAREVTRQGGLRRTNMTMRNWLNSAPGKA
jgi:hypothetical protein